MSLFEANLIKDNDELKSVYPATRSQLPGVENAIYCRAHGLGFFYDGSGLRCEGIYRKHADDVREEVEDRKITKDSLKAQLVL